MPRRFLLLALGLFLLAASAAAQVVPPSTSSVILQATGDPAGVSVDLQVAVTEDLDPQIHGFDVYRTVLGDCAAGTERLTDEPFLRGAVGVHTFFLQDTAADGQNVVYGYQVRVVDASRQEISPDAFDIYVGEAYGSWGAAPVVGVGQILSSDAVYPVLEPCPGACFRGYYVFSNAVTPYVDTGQIVRLTGTLTCSTSEGCIILANSADPTSCSVSVGERSWGALKAAY
jgi:hypothetical protein